MTQPAARTLQKRFLLAGTLAALNACAIFSPSQPYLPNRAGLEAGETITVKTNENIYGIAHAHNVAMRDLIVLNNLKPPFEVKPGQRIVLPAGGSFTGDSMPPPVPAPRDAVERNDLSPIEPAGVSSESLQPLAAAPASPSAPMTAHPFGAASAPLQLTPPSPVKTPASVQTFAPSAAVPPALSTASEPVAALNRPVPAQKPVVTTTTETVKSPSSAASDSDGDSNSSGEMVWPVQGPILSAYGSKGPGLNNDGINIGAPKGAPVTAAAGGTVVYAGNEMKGFGNLVLIRHAGDWVTAYAHLDRVLVRKDSVVAQGDMIGTVGKTGNVTSPQLHFETRKDGKPVDPAGVVKGNP